MAEAKRDYYEVLGVSKDVDEATFEKRHIVKLAQKVSSGYESGRCRGGEEV